MLATLLATAISWAVVQAVSTAVVDQPSPLSHGAVSRELRSPTPEELPPTPAPAPSPSSPPAAAPTPSTGGGGQQSNPTPPPSRPAPSPVAATTTRTFTLVGGTAQLSCTNNQVRLDWATPNSGFWVETGSSDSGGTIDIKFRSDSHESELQSWCSGNQVQGSVQEKSS